MYTLLGTDMQIFQYAFYNKGYGYHKIITE